MESIYFATALVATTLGIALFRHFGPRFGTYDVPNERSSHSTPTLRGGGIVIVAVCLILYFASPLYSGERPSWGFVVGGVLIAGISLIDDARSLPAWVRFGAHSVAACILLSSAGGIQRLWVPVYGSLGIAQSFSYILSFLWIVWMINAYNFMDGIDGIAGMQAVIAGVGWAALGLWSGDSSTFVLGGIIAFSCLGFLIHNWSPARVFMGDVGSAFLGYTLAAMPILASEGKPDNRPWLFTAAISFVWLFLFDTAFTLIRRLHQRERVWLAHRKHLYQRLVISGWKHDSTSLLYAACALMVTASFVLAITIDGIATLFLLFMYAFAPMVITFFAFRKKS